MASDELQGLVEELLSAAGILDASVKIREFPDEVFAVVGVAPNDAINAESMVRSIEHTIAKSTNVDADSVTALIRRQTIERDATATTTGKGKLQSPAVDQLIRLLEARSRTSASVPSLEYKEDPRASIQAITAGRHHLIYGRRGVGKTALLLEVKRSVEDRGDSTAWLNAQVIRDLPPAMAFLHLASEAIRGLQKRIRNSGSAHLRELEQLNDELVEIQTASEIHTFIPKLNRALRALLSAETLQLFLFIDDFYLYPVASQPRLLDFLAATFRDCSAWIKLASIERLTRTFEPSTRIGLEIPHDASMVDLDVTLENPASTQKFLESVLRSYAGNVGIKSIRSIAKAEALGRLVLSSGGVPRDYLNLFSNSIVAARNSRSSAAEIGKQDVSKAAGDYAQSKKKDLEQDVSPSDSQRLLEALESLSLTVKGSHYTYFRVNLFQKSEPSYELLARLVDLRFCHLVQATVSDQHRAGIKYEAYLLSLSEYSDIRVQRNLNLLDIEGGQWIAKTTGRAQTSSVLSGTQLRDRLRQAPIVELSTIWGSLQPMSTPS